MQNAHWTKFMVDWLNGFNVRLDLPWLTGDTGLGTRKNIWY